jgi:hypothetical protein
MITPPHTSYVSAFMDYLYYIEDLLIGKYVGKTAKEDRLRVGGDGDHRH